MEKKYLIKQFTLVLFFLIITLSVPIHQLYADELFGVVTSGEIGSADEGKLLNIDFATGIATEVGDTGLESLTALTFDPNTKTLIAGNGYGEIYVLDQDTGTPTKIVDVLIGPPQSEIPAGVIFLGFRSLSSLEFHPISGELFGVVQDMLGDFLVRIDLDAVDALGRLEFEVIGVVGSDNYAYPGAPLGFRTVFGIAFDTLGTLFGSGIDPNVFKPLLIQIQTTPGAIPLSAAVGSTASSILSFPRAMAFRPSDGFLYSTGYNTSHEHVLFRFDPNSGDEAIRGELRIQGSSGSPVPVSGQVSGIALVTELPNLPPRPPVITGFSPPGGNLGIPVRILGSGFSANGSPNVSRVRFDGYPALGDPVVVSDTELRVITPLASTGPITVMNSEGTATSMNEFINSTMEITPEFNQGIPTQPLIAGKDTLVRLLTASSASTNILPIPVTFGSATLTYTKPSGATLSIPATHYTKIFQNSSDRLDPSHRSNINFYIDGEDLDEDGTYLFSLEVRHFTLDESIPGPLMFYSDEVEDLIPGMDKFTALIVLGGVRVNGDFVGPDEASMDNIITVFDEISRTYPLRDGVSRLGQDLTAGVRFEISSTAVVLGTGLNSANIDDDLFEAGENTVVPMLESYNDSNTDKARFAAIFAGNEAFTAGSAFGMGEWPGNFSISSVRDVPDSVKTSPHEFGHNMGLVPESSPNYNTSDFAHTVNDMFPPGGDPRQVRAFNVPDRLAVLDRFGQPILPRAIMRGGTTPANGQMFLEDFEYEFTRNAYELPSTSAASLFTNSGLKLFTIIANIHSSGTADVIQSYESTTDKPITKTTPGSPHSLAFLDTSGNVIREDPFSVSFWVGDSENDMTEKSSTVVALVRPIPEDTARVELRLDGQTLVFVERSGESPSVEILFPMGGESFTADEQVEIHWDASDPDGTPLTFNVSYSPDGTRWTPIAAAISGCSTIWYTGTSAGSDAGKIRVSATDGFHIVSAESASFTVAQKAPMVTIRKPENGQHFLEHDIIGLRGVAFDFESGMLAGNALEWSSNIAGPLGTGTEIDLPPGTLIPGEHIIQLSATDGIEFKIKEISITVLADTDGDRIPDDFENSYGSQDPNDPFDSAQDVDSDGLTSLEESDAGTDPENPDSDGDGMSDGEEISAGGDPTKANLPPECSAGGPYLIECAGPTTSVTLDGTNSTDPDDDDLTYIWSGSFTNGTVSGATPTVQFSGVGEFSVTLKVNDGFGGFAECGADVKVVDTTFPEITVLLSKDCLWPPNHKMVPIEATIQASDICDQNPQVELVSITSSEPDNGLGDGDTSNDIQGASFGTDDRSFSLRAERSGTGNGRIYTITYKAIDSSGNESIASTEVYVAKAKSYTSDTVGTTGGTETTPNNSCTVDVPEGAVSGETAISITDNGSGSMETSSGDVQAVLDVQLYSDTPVVNEPITVSLTWPDADNNGVIDGTRSKESMISVNSGEVQITGNCVNGICVCVNRCSECKCSFTENYFEIAVDSFSEFAISVPSDLDVDGIPDNYDSVVDNCPSVANPLQEDTSPPQGNNCGNACECEGNYDGDSDVDGTDAVVFKSDFGRNRLNKPCANSGLCNGDFTCDMDVDGSDAAVFKTDFGRNGLKNPCPNCITIPWCVYP